MGGKDETQTGKCRASMPDLRLFAGGSLKSGKPVRGWGGQAGLELGFQAALVGQQGDKPQERMRFVGIGGGVRGRAVHSALAFE